MFIWEERNHARVISLDSLTFYTMRSFLQNSSSQLFYQCTGLSYSSAMTEAETSICRKASLKNNQLVKQKLVAIDCYEPAWKDNRKTNEITTTTAAVAVVVAVAIIFN
uniref:Uncharacterized protein n=1 Tax=Glossina austeni TaxID=7395 RepID=A0A1A9VUQ2_GLOAU